jgi:hypothetical protein
MLVVQWERLRFDDTKPLVTFWAFGGIVYLFGIVAITVP